MADTDLPRWQISAAALPDRCWDVVIVGCGPAGATAALHLARLGRSVCVLDRAAFPRDKACGDLLIPDSINALRRSGLYDEVVSVAHAPERALVSSPSRIDWTIGGEYLSVRRIDLDLILARGAARAGAAVAKGRVGSLAPEDGGVAAALTDGTRVRARLGVLATGADVSLLDQLGMLERKEPSSFALRSYVRSDAAIDPVVIAFDRAIVPGYAWIFPMRNGTYNVGVGQVLRRRGDRNLHELFESFLDDYPLARRLMAGATRMDPAKGARLRCGLTGARFRSELPVLAIGESIGTTFPFTGEGVGKAMESAELAVETIHGALSRPGLAGLAEYRETVARHLEPRYYGYRIAERWLSHPRLNDLLSWRIARSRYLRDAAEGIITETTDPRELFSIRGLVRSFLN